MKVLIKTWRQKKPEEVDLRSAVEGFIGNTFRDGSIERVEEKADNTAMAVGELVNLLAEKNLLSDEEIMKFTGDCLVKVLR